MSENERLRQVFESEHRDFVRFVSDPMVFGDDDEMRNEHH